MVHKRTDKRLKFMQFILDKPSERNNIDFLDGTPSGQSIVKLFAYFVECRNPDQRPSLPPDERCGMKKLMH